MKVLINDKLALLSEEASLQLQRKLAAALSKFGSRVKDVEISISDVNGLRGGIDKECRLVVNIMKMTPVISASQDASLTKAISRSIVRAERAVARRIQKRTIAGRNPKSDLGFAFYH